MSTPEEAEAERRRMELKETIDAIKKGYKISGPGVYRVEDFVENMSDVCKCSGNIINILGPLGPIVKIASEGNWERAEQVAKEVDKHAKELESCAKTQLNELHENIEKNLLEPIREKDLQRLAEGTEFITYHAIKDFIGLKCEV
jgi:hypothetical protein